jgi:hypothetical protein
MAKGHSRKVFEQIISMVKEEVSHTLGATMSSIALVASKTFLWEHLLIEDGQGPVEVLKGDKLCQVMDRFPVLSFPNVQNLVVFLKH